MSAWFRFKYPNSVDGALAASAPIYIVANLTSPYAFFGLVTQVRVLMTDNFYTIPLIVGERSEPS